MTLDSRLPTVDSCDSCDVLIVGAGPSGAVAATVLARAGARVRLIDRATFPRDKLCGDTVNPGTLAILRRLGLATSIEDRGLRIEGMRLTGENGVGWRDARAVGTLHRRGGHAGRNRERVSGEAVQAG